MDAALRGRPPSTSLPGAGGRPYGQFARLRGRCCPARGCRAPCRTGLRRFPSASRRAAQRAFPERDAARCRRPGASAPPPGRSGAPPWGKARGRHGRDAAHLDERLLPVVEACVELAQRLPHDAVRRRHAHDPIMLRSVAPCKGGGRLIRHARYVIWQLVESPLDADSLSADSRAHQPTHVVADLIERRIDRSSVMKGGGRAGVPLKSTVGDLRRET